MTQWHTLLLAQSTNETVQAVIRFLRERGLQFALNVVVAILIFFIGKAVAKILVGVVKRFCQRKDMDSALVDFFSNVAYALLLTFVVLAALDRLGVPTTSLAAVLAAAGLAVGLALQGSLSNFAAGVMIIFFKPFRPGNYIEGGGVKGTVEAIQLFHTTLKSPDNVRIIVPNSQLTSDTITNYSVNPTRRIDLVVGCGYNDNLKEVKSFLEELVRSEERVLAEPEPVVAVHELADNSVNFVVRPWVKTSEYWATRWDLIEKIKMGFDERGFSIPFPQRDVHIHNANSSEVA